MRSILLFAAVLVAFTGCRKEEEETPSQPLPEVTETGTYFINEGNFTLSNASISYLNANGELALDPFFTANGYGLGDVLTSFVRSNGKGYAVLNNSDKVEVFNVDTWESVGTISGIVYPRRIISGGNGKLYLSSGSFAGTVHVINEATMSIESTIAVGSGPEKMAISDGKLYVCNSGGWAQDNTVSIIDIATNTLLSTIEVGDRPQDIEVDGTGDVWVMCEGKTVYADDWTTILLETKTRMVKIEHEDNSIGFSQELGEVGDHGFVLEMSQDGTKLFYALDGVWTLPVSNATSAATLFVTGNYSSIDCNSNGEVWLTSVSNFVNPSAVYRYTPTGNLLETFTAGIGTNAVVFF